MAGLINHKLRLIPTWENIKEKESNGFVYAKEISGFRWFISVCSLRMSQNLYVAVKWSKYITADLINGLKLIRLI